MNIGTKPLEFKYIENDPNDQAGHYKGYQIHKVEAFLDGEPVGYLRIAHVDPKLVAELFPTIWHWVRQHLGWGMNPDDLRDVWMEAHRHAGMSPESQDIAPWAIVESTAAATPDEVLESDLERVDKRRGLTKEYKQWARQVFDRPFVDYIRVKDEYQGRGIGKALYIAGAKWMAERFGLSLRSSGLQSEQAAAVWKRLAADPELPIRKARAWGKPVYVLDYTQ